MKVKTRVPDMKRKEIIYKISCRDCDAVYIGETGRSLQKRLREHKYSVKTNNQKNSIAMHAWDNNHQPDWDAAETMENEPHYWKRQVLEAIWIKKIPQNANLDCGPTLSDTWTQFIRK